MAANGAEGGGRAAGRSRIAVAGAIGGGLVVVAFGSLWIERAPIVAHFVDRTLADRHVAARYRIAAIGPFAQRLEDVSIGDPAAPDLTARSVELRLGYGLSGPYLAGVTADGVRLSTRVADGRLSMGALDRLLPASSGNGPVTLPDVALALTDARVRLATPAGLVTAAIDGSGGLSDGFDGHVTAQSGRLAAGGCVVARPVATMRVRVVDHAPRVTGPLDLAGIACGTGVRAGAGRATLDLAFARTLDRWRGGVALAGFAGRVPGARFGALGGDVSVAGDLRRVTGTARLTAAGFAADAARVGRLGIEGGYRYAAGLSGLVFAGNVRAEGVAVSAALRRRIAMQAAGSTPLEPVVAQAARAAAAALAKADADATIAFTAGGPAGTAIKLQRLAMTSVSGARVAIAAGSGFGWSVADGGWRADGRASVSGGGLPTLAVDVTQPRAGAPIAGTVRMEPYAAGDSRLALTPVTVRDSGGVTRFATTATIAGPLAGGRVDGLTLPIAGNVARGVVTIGEGCVPVGVDRLAISGATIERAHVTACGIGGAPVLRVAGGTVRAGVAIDALSVAGRTGSAPLTLAAAGVQVTAAGLHARDVAVRIGAGELPTRLDIATLDGKFANGVGGNVAGAGGRIGAVPLLLSEGTGRWTIADGALSIDGALTVADAGDPARFKPMHGEAVHLTLKGGRIAATGTLHEPRSDARIADVSLTHDLATGRGGATLAVPGIVFDKKLQPEMLTPVTLGVIANVAGTVAGDGRIGWTAQSVASSGTFHTDRVDLAAAFGPVTGIAGTIRFSDLLALETPPGQEATIAEINPGISVTAGLVHYQLLSGQRVRVEDARWPFAGGALTLDPSTLEFGATSSRRLTFRLKELDAAAFVQQLAFPNLSATGVFDGTLPMVFDQTGGRIEGGGIVARAPGGTVAYLGQLSKENVGTMGSLVFDALKAIRYRSLSIGLDGRIDGEIVSRVQFVGVRQATPESGIVARLIRNLPFRFNIAIRAPFRSLLGTARSYVDPSLLLATPTPPDPAPIQPPESEPVR